MARLFVATRNRGKLEEMHRLLAEHVDGVQVLGIDDVEHYDEPVEDQPDFAGNAMLKARAGAQATGLPSLADDSGLCVDALNGMPGVLSARWSGPPKSDARNNELLLAQLADVPVQRRGAHFRCAVAFCAPASHGAAVEWVVEGRMDGRIIDSCRGEGGFGYDVLFVAEEHLVADDPMGGLTSAELTPTQKDAISHRGRALREAAPRVAQALRD